MDSKQVGNTRKPPNAGKGRPKGSQNKTTSLAKAVIAEVGDRLGGADRLLAWAKEDAANEKAFWTNIYLRLLPVQLESGPAGLTINIGGEVRKL